MITKEELAKLSRDEVKKLFYEKRNTCKTCAQFGEMIFNDQEYIMIKERLSEFFIEDRIKNEQRKKAQAVKEFAEKIKNLLLVTNGDYAPLGEITGEDIVCDIDKLLEEYTK